MLPFQKRSVQGNQGEDISTEDVVEVVHKVRHAASAALSSRNFGSTLRSNEIPGAAPSRRHGADRPRVPSPIPTPSRAIVSRPVAAQFGEDEDEMTCLMPAKGLIIPPPVQTRRAPAPQHVMSSNTSFRPAPIPRNLHPQSQMYDASPNERRIHRMPPAAVLAARQESAVVPQAPASLAPMAMPMVDSEPHINPGATVVTARTLSRPTASWAAALVAMGIFAGLVTAAVARGDFSSSDQKVAAASQGAGEQVIPSQPQSQPASSPALPVYMASQPAAPMAISSPLAANAAPAEAVAVAAKFAPTKSAPKAAAPALHVSHPAAPAADKSEPKVEAKADVKEEKKEEKKVASKGKKDSADMASAKSTNVTPAAQ